MAEVVGAYLMMAGQLIDEDPQAAYLHAEAARRRAARLPIAREATAETAYAAGLYEEALAQYRTLRRMNGSSDIVPVMVDCLRALGKYREALELAGQGMPEITDPSMRIELLIVTAGVRADMGQREEGMRLLRREIEHPTGRHPRGAQSRLLYAFSDLLAQAGDMENARRGFAQAASLDPEGATAALDRLDELDGFVFDLDEGEFIDEGREDDDDIDDANDGMDDDDDYLDDHDRGLAEGGDDFYDLVEDDDDIDDRNGDLGDDSGDVADRGGDLAKGADDPDNLDRTFVEDGDDGDRSPGRLPENSGDIVESAGDLTDDDVAADQLDEDLVEEGGDAVESSGDCEDAGVSVDEPGEDLAEDGHSVIESGEGSAGDGGDVHGCDGDSAQGSTDRVESSGDFDEDTVVDEPDGDLTQGGAALVLDETGDNDAVQDGGAAQIGTDS